MRKLSLPRKIYDILTRRWMLATALLSTPSIAFSLIQIVGVRLGLKDTNGELTSIGTWVFWSTVFGATGFQALKSRADHYVDKLQRDGQFLHRRLTDATTAIAVAKLDRFCEYIQQHGVGSASSPFHSITQPKVQVQRILENLEAALAELCGLSRAEIGTSLAIKYGTSGSWEWLQRPSADNELDLNHLTRSPQSTFAHVVTGPTSSVIHPDKRVAADAQAYLPSPRDGAFGGIGSLVCRRIAVSAPEECVTAVLSVSTYGKQLFEYGDGDTERKLATIVLPPFEVRLRLELALLYIKERVAATP